MSTFAANQREIETPKDEIESSETDQREDGAAGTNRMTVSSAGSE
jgi:hypothetical protein